MMKLALLYTSETTSTNTDETRHPSVKKPLPMRKQVSDGNAIHGTHLTNPNTNNLDRTAHESGQKFKTERRHKTHHETAPHESTTLNTKTKSLPKATTQHCCSQHAPQNWLQNNECWRMEDHMPSSAPCWNHLTRKLLQQWAINNRHTSTSDLIINWHPNTTRFAMLHNNSFHIIETTLRTLIKLGMELHTHSDSSTSWLDRSPTKHK